MNDLRNDPEDATVRGQFTRLPDLLHGLRIIDGHELRAADLRTADQRHADDLAALRTEIDDIKATLHKQALWLKHELRERGA